MMANFDNKSGAQAQAPAATDGESEDPNADKEILAAIKTAKAAKPDGTDFTYDDKDVILYNLGLGAKRTDLPLVYEGADGFTPLPSFGVIPSFNAAPAFSIGDVVPNFNPMMLLHGEQFLEIKEFPIPTEATLVCEPFLVEVVDKGKAALVVIGSTAKDKNTGKEVFYNESTTFLRGSGGFGGLKQMPDRGPATAANEAPKREPDHTHEEKTTEEQAAIYRLSGDRNPLHIDPSFSAMGGFKTPILHGLCFFGVCTKHVVQKYGMIKNVKVRFAGPVLPGQTIKTEMWKEGNKIIFQAKVVETGKLCIAGGGAELLDGGKTKL